MTADDRYGPPLWCTCGICQKCNEKNNSWSVRLNELTDEQRKRLHEGIQEGIATLSGKAVDHPPHYKPGKFEVIDVIEDWQLGFHLGNALKYIARAGRKDPTKTAEDIEKAIWYLNRWKELFGNAG